jgi:hypothetical protein
LSNSPLDAGDNEAPIFATALTNFCFIIAANFGL